MHPHTTSTLDDITRKPNSIGPLLLGLRCFLDLDHVETYEDEYDNQHKTRALARQPSNDVTYRAVGFVSTSPPSLHRRPPGCRDNGNTGP